MIRGRKSYLHTNSHLDNILSIDINYMTATSRYTYNFPKRVNGWPIPGHIVTFPGILMCHKLIKILWQVTLEWLGSATKYGFWRALSIEWLENTIGVEYGDNGIPKIDCEIPIYIPCEKFTVNLYGGRWDLIKTKHKKVKQKYQK